MSNIDTHQLKREAEELAKKRYEETANKYSWQVMVRKDIRLPHERSAYNCLDGHFSYVHHYTYKESFNPDTYKYTTLAEAYNRALELNRKHLGENHDDKDTRDFVLKCRFHIFKNGKNGGTVVLPWNVPVWVPEDAENSDRGIKMIDLNWGIIHQACFELKYTFDKFLAGYWGGGVTPEIYKECTGRDLIKDIRFYLKGDKRVKLPKEN